MNNKKEGEYYSQMVRRYKNEYGGKNLQEFCIKEKVSYTKMLHSLRNDSYCKPYQTNPVKPVIEREFIKPQITPMTQIILKARRKKEKLRNSIFLTTNSCVPMVDFPYGRQAKPSFVPSMESGKA